MSYRKLVNYILYGLMAFLGLLSVIDSFISVSHLSGNSSSMLWFMWFLNLLVGVFFIIAGVNGFMIQKKNLNARDKLFANSSFPIAYLILAALIIIFIIQGEYGGDLNTKGILIVVFYFIGVIGLGVSSILKIDTYQIPKVLIGELSTFIILITYIINLSSSSSSTLGTVISIILIFIFLIFMVQIPLLTSKFDEGNKPQQQIVNQDPVYNEIPRSSNEILPDQPTPKAERKEESPVEKLRELKKLKDDGILSDEEYESISKKYKEKL